jgi:hypothetical protein
MLSSRKFSTANETNFTWRFQPVLQPASIPFGSGIGIAKKNPRSGERGWLVGLRRETAYLRGWLIWAWAAANRAMGTRKGEQLT